MIMSGRFIAPVLISVGVLFIAGCGGTGGSASSPAADSGTNGSQGSESKVIILNLYSPALPYFQDVARGVTDASTAAGYTAEIVFGQTDPALQFTQVQNSISKRPAGIILGPYDTQSLIPVVREAANAGIPVVTVADNIAEEGREFQLAFVGADYEELGAFKAQRIIDVLDGKGRVGVVHGIRGADFSETQWRGAKAVFDRYPDIEIIDVGYAGDFAADLGLEKTENILTIAPNVDAIYFDNDDLALGGILAAKARGIPMENIFIVGTDGGLPARDAARAGELDFSISLCGYATGVLATGLIVAKNEAGTDPSGPRVPVPFFEFTPDNINNLEAAVAENAC